MVQPFLRTIAAVLVLVPSWCATIAAAESSASPSATPAATLPPQLIAALQSRGIIGGKLTDDLASTKIPDPPPGVEVDETRAGRIDSGPDVTFDDWTEPFGSDLLRIRTMRRDDGTSEV